MKHLILNLSDSGLGYNKKNISKLSDSLKHLLNLEYLELYLNNNSLDKKLQPLGDCLK